MRIVNTREMLKEAKKNGYAVPAFNVDQLDSTAAVLRVCERLRAPVIIQLSPVQTLSKGLAYKTLIQMIEAAGAEFDVDMAVHLDHGTDPADVKRAVKSGFTSVMFDGSRLSFQDNKRITSEIRAYCGELPLEGELGVVGGQEGSRIDGAGDMLYTDVKEAVEYVRDSRVDFLAVAIGNSHGIYRQRPELNFDVLEKLNSALDLPLVLHGASGLSEEDIKTGIRLGISKINFFTDVDRAFMEGIRREMNEDPSAYSFSCFANGGKYVEAQIERIVKMCGCEGRGSL